ncbi:hypothetical protein QE152_g4023 [Popillia japonica]|uniref:Major facilitator superfamily (MFS) profile domain-containing protein n=1 Tax=Popillia japonica TaxID=7064 RepID=A0AAW1MYA3_POPJA
MSVILLTIALTCIGAMYSGHMTNHIDIANNYAGTLMGLTNTIGTIPGIVGPVFVGAMTNVDPSMASWRIVFYVTIIIIVIEIIAFTIFGTGEEQSWNKQQQAEAQAAE